MRILRYGLLAIFTGALLVAAAPARFALANDDYTFVDANGAEVKLPTNIPIYTRQNPGPWKRVIAMHEPKIKTRIRMTGLEAVRIVDISLDHPMDEDGENGRIEKIYVEDKDNLIIGYYKFSKGEKRAAAQLLINGNINYFEIYIQCSKHGMWHSNYRLN